MSDEASGSFHHFSRQQLAVANNGKVIFGYTYWSGTRYEARAVTANLTDVTPAIADIVTNGSGAGIVYNSGARHLAVAFIALLTLRVERFTMLQVLSLPI
jgi:ABC-type Fe3+ transport system substrate-binding protein